MKKRKKFYDRARSTQSIGDWEAYRKAHNKVIQSLSEAHQNYTTRTCLITLTLTFTRGFGL